MNDNIFYLQQHKREKAQKSLPLAVPETHFTDPTVSFNLKTVHLDESMSSPRYVYSKTCVKRPLKKRPKIGFQDQLWLNAGRHSFCGRYSQVSL